MTYLLKVFPEVFRPSQPMDPTKVEQIATAWTKPKSGNGWRKAVKGDSQRQYHADDVAEDFYSRYVGYSPAKVKSKAARLAAMLDELDAMELLDSLDEYVSRNNDDDKEENPLTVAEKFVADGMTQTFSPIRAEVDPAKVELEARPFHRPVKLSALRKVLKSDPNHFK